MKLNIALLSTAATLVPFTQVGAQALPANQPALVESDFTSGAAEAGVRPTPGNAAKAHDDEDEAIVVTGTKRSNNPVGSVSVLDEDELAHDLKPSLGDTLSDLPGVSASSFGPSSSRPILRGEQGERAPLLVDGISSLDLSASDPDHAVTINPVTASRIEVLHGPGALIYAPSPVAGVVNVIDTRIPRAIPEDIDADVLLNYGSAASERSGNASMDVPLGEHFVAHVDGAYSKYDDLRIGGYVLSERLRREALASPDPDIRALAALKSTLPNSAGRTDDIAGGAAYIDGDLNVGLSYSHHDARYGVPIRYSLDPSIEPERPTIDAHQDRGDARVNVPVGGLFDLFEFRGGISRYHHAELGPGNVVGSRFYSNGGEMRADLVQAERGGWGGTTGIQYFDQDARIRGDEKYLPDSRKRNLGVFTLQSFERGKLRLEAAARVDLTRLNAKQDEAIADLVAETGFDDFIGTRPVVRRFTAWTGSAGATYEFVPNWRIGLAISHSERAPSVQELFSFGPHAGSEEFLVGDPDLRLEKSNGIELSLRRTSGAIRFQGSLYYSHFSNYLFEVPTGGTEDGLPVYRRGQGQADYYGFELESEVKFGEALGIRWGGELTTDAVRARIRNFGNAPEIPPFRVMAGLTGTRGQIDGRVEAERVSAQRKTAPNETSTAGYTVVNASLDWHPFAANPKLTLSLTGNNLFDVDARRHSSDLKDYAPLAGRDIRVSARIGF